MKPITSLLLSSLACVACSVVDPGAAMGAAPTRRVAVDEAFRLKAGEAVVVDELQLGFEAVLQDSRCPKGEQCIVAGDVTLRLWLQQGAGERLTRDLRLAASGAATARALGHDVQLLALDPYPVSGRPVKATDYVATLKVGRSRGPAPAPLSADTSER